MLLKFCIIIESNYQKTISAIALCTNMAAVTSGANQEFINGGKGIILLSLCEPSSQILGETFT